MKKILLIIVLGLLISVKGLKAQGYRHAAGIALGSPVAFSFKTFMIPDGKVTTAFEGLLGFSFGNHFNGFSALGFYEWHHSLTSGLRVYYGPGVQIGAFSTKDNYNHTDGFTLGIAGALGLDYKFADLPINLALGWMPSFNFTGYDGLHALGLALHVRYTF